MSLNRDALIDHARRSFSFLEEEGGRREIEDWGSSTVLAYVGDRATFELEFDFREAVVLLLVARTINGRRPPGYYMHEGSRVRVHLAKALDLVGDHRRAAALRAMVRHAGAEAMESLTEGFASTLRDSLDDLLANLDVVFERP